MCLAWNDAEYSWSSALRQHCDDNCVQRRHNDCRTGEYRETLAQSNNLTFNHAKIKNSVQGRQTVSWSHVYASSNYMNSLGHVSEDSRRHYPGPSSAFKKWSGHVVQITEMLSYKGMFGYSPRKKFRFTTFLDPMLLHLGLRGFLAYKKI